MTCSCKFYSRFHYWHLSINFLVLLYTKLHIVTYHQCSVLAVMSVGSVYAWHYGIASHFVDEKMVSKLLNSHFVHVVYAFTVVPDSRTHIQSWDRIATWTGLQSFSGYYLTSTYPSPRTSTKKLEFFLARRKSGPIVTSSLHVVKENREFDKQNIAVASWENNVAPHFGLSLFKITG